MKGRDALVYAARASVYKIEKGYVVRGISRILSLGGEGGRVWAKGRHLTAENTLSATLAGFVYSHGRIQQRAIRQPRIRCPLSLSASGGAHV